MDKTGYVGNLHDKTQEELLDLLHRQEKLYENKKFILKLADKGSKIKAMIEKIKTVLATKESVDESARMLERLSIAARSAEYGVVDLGEIINTGGTDKIIVDESSPYVNSYDRVTKRTRKEVKRFQTNRLKDQSNNIGTSHPSNSTGTYHSSNTDTSQSSSTVVCQSSNNIDSTVLNKDILNCQSDKSDSLQDRKIDINGSVDNVEKCSIEENTKGYLISTTGQIGANGDCISNLTNDDSHHIPRLKFRYDECLQAGRNAPVPVHNLAKEISIEESIILLNQQKDKLQEIQLRQASERLNSTHQMKIGVSNQKRFTEFRYETKESVSDSDDDEKELDYPD